MDNNIDVSDKPQDDNEAVVSELSHHLVEEIAEKASVEAQKEILDAETEQVHSIADQLEHQIADLAIAEVKVGILDTETNSQDQDSGDGVGGVSDDDSTQLVHEIVQNADSSAGLGTDSNLLNIDVKTIIRDCVQNAIDALESGLSKKIAQAASNDRAPSQTSKGNKEDDDDDDGDGDGDDNTTTNNNINENVNEVVGEKKGMKDEDSDDEDEEEEIKVKGKVEVSDSDDDKEVVVGEKEGIKGESILEYIETSHVSLISQSLSPVPPSSSPAPTFPSPRSLIAQTLTSVNEDLHSRLSSANTQSDYNKLALANEVLQSRLSAAEIQQLILSNEALHARLSVQESQLTEVKKMVSEIHTAFTSAKSDNRDNTLLPQIVYPSSVHPSETFYESQSNHSTIPRIGYGDMPQSNSSSYTGGFVGFDSRSSFESPQRYSRGDDISRTIRDSPQIVISSQSTQQPFSPLTDSSNPSPKNKGKSNKPTTMTQFALMTDAELRQLFG